MSIDIKVIKVDKSIAAFDSNRHQMATEIKARLEIHPTPMSHVYNLCFFAGKEVDPFCHVCFKCVYVDVQNGVKLDENNWATMLMDGCRGNKGIELLPITTTTIEALDTFGLIDFRITYNDIVHYIFTDIETTESHDPRATLKNVSVIKQPYVKAKSPISVNVMHDHICAFVPETDDGEEVIKTYKSQLRELVIPYVRGAYYQGNYEFLGHYIRRLEYPNNQDNAEFFQKSIFDFNYYESRCGKVIFTDELDPYNLLFDTLRNGVLHASFLHPSTREEILAKLDRFYVSNCRDTKGLLYNKLNSLLELAKTIRAFNDAAGNMKSRFGAERVY